MDHNNHNVDSKASQARQKRKLCLKTNKKSGSRKVSKKTPLSDITYSSLNTKITSHTNVPNLPTKVNVSTTTPFSGIDTINLCENIQPTSISNPNQKKATLKHGQTTLMHFLHDKSNCVKSQSTIRSIIESNSISNLTNQTHSSNIPYNKSISDGRIKRKYLV